MADPPRIVRIYDHEQRSVSERRVLVDRLWPRGISKAEADLDWWCKEVAPSTDLRRWYGHDIERFDGFDERYRQELSIDPALGALNELRVMANQHDLVLITATRDVEHSGARVLLGVLTDGGL